MSGGRNIRAIDAEGGETGARETLTESETIAAGQSGEEHSEWEEDWEDPDATTRFGWVFPTFALILIAGWTGLFGWANRAQMLTPSSVSQWVDWIAQWSLPVALVLAGWILFQRNSRREADRYARAAGALSAASAELEQRLTTVNRELSLAREFLTSQGLELESFGRVTSERLSEHAERLQSLVHDNGAQVDRIASVSTTALDNMDRLRGDLPVIANSARDVANQIGNAGTTAEGQIERLVAGFDRLNEFGQASAKQVNALGEKVDTALAAFEAQARKMEDITSTRFATLRETSEAFRAELDVREVESLAALRRRAEQLAEELASSGGSIEEQEEEALKSMRARLTGLRTESETIARAIRDGEEESKALWIVQIDSMKERLATAVEQIKAIDEQALDTANRKLQALRDEAMQVDERLAERNDLFNAQMAERKSAIETGERDALESLKRQLEMLDAELETRRQRQTEQAAALQETTTATAARVSELADEIEAMVARGSAAQNDLLGASEAIRSNLSTSREEIATTQGIVTSMTEASVRLLELIQASAQHSRSELPVAMEAAEARLLALRGEAEALNAIVATSLERSESISDYVIATDERSKALDQRTGELQDRLRTLGADYARELDRLRGAMRSLEEEGRTAAEGSLGALREAIDVLQDKTRQAMVLAGQQSSGTIDTIAQNIAARSAEAIDRAVREQADGAIAELDRAATRSTGAAREAALQLRDQLALVNELAGNLENRVALARERAEEQVDNDFARRVALITEALNSNSIDIAKSLSTDVTDTAWASYLRGDRGIFTRRAVSLLSNTEAREIAELYDSDHEFREHVSRYIADFETMLRTMLSTRDGNAIGVTLLSSDMGKLYVAMAQAIERLRQD